MKKSLLALAVLGAFAGVASAQSSVTLSGMVDAGVKNVKDNYSLGGSQSGYNNFAITVREDLGGGMTAFGYLQHRFNIGNGNSNTASASAPNAAGTALNPPTQSFWRNAFVGLAGGFGDIRLGRMLMPLQDMNGGFDAFATGYVATTHTGGINATVRANEAIYYRSPSLGGFSVHAAIAAAGPQWIDEVNDPGRKYFTNYGLLNSERPVGFNARYAAGPINVGVAYDVNAANQKTTAAYGSYDFGFLKLFGQYETSDDVRNSSFSTPTSFVESIDTYSISATMPVGKFLLKAGYLTISSDSTKRDGSKFGLGGQYNLSKRTELYANVGKFQGDRFNAAEEKTTMFDLGITHRF